MTDLITPINIDRTCGPGGGRRSLCGVNCRFCVTIFAHSDIAKDCA